MKTISDRTGDAKLMLGICYVLTGLVIWFFLWPLARLCGAANGVPNRTEEWIQITRSAYNSLSILMMLVGFFLLTGIILVVVGIVERICNKWALRRQRMAE